MRRVIRKNNRGKLQYNIRQNEFYIEFSNVQFTLPMNEYLKFENQLKTMLISESEYTSNDKIKVPVKYIGISFVLIYEDFLSLLDLFGIQSEKMISFKLKINYSMN